MQNLNFKLFIEHNTEFQKNVKEMLKNIPKSHAKLVKDYDVICQKDNVLTNDKENVGEIDEKNKKIKISSPWNYSRCFVFLHEVAHAVYKYKMNASLKNKWKKLVEKVKKDNKKHNLEKDVEEVFCMIYAQFYCKNKMEKYAYPELENFIKKVPK